MNQMTFQFVVSSVDENLTP